MRVNPTQASDYITKAIRAGLVVMLQGDPGIGKSMIILAVAHIFNLKVIDIRLAQCDPTDLNGFPTNKDGKASYLPMDTFPLEGDPLPSRMVNGVEKQYDGFLIFFDEFNSAPLSVQAASYKIVLDRMIGQFKLHPRAAIVCAGNLTTNNAIVNRMGTAMQSRLVHLELQTDLKSWIAWASKNGIDHRIIAYVQQKPENLHKFDPKHNDKTFACPRTWEFASKLIINEPDNIKDYTALLCGTIGKGIGREFITWSNMYTEIPSFDEIKKDPKGCKLPDEPAIKYAISHLIAANVSEKNLDMVFPYIERLPVEFETITLQNILHRNISWLVDSEGNLTHEKMRDWVTNKSVELFL